MNANPNVTTVNRAAMSGFGCSGGTEIAGPLADRDDVAHEFQPAALPARRASSYS
jgi:hypothetical protein